MSGTTDPARPVPYHCGGYRADGWAGLPPRARELVLGAAVVLGGKRHLAMLPDAPAQRRVPWPSPLRAGLPALLASLTEEPAVGAVAAIASGDPLVSGIGTTLIKLLGRDAVTTVPAVSSVALAAPSWAGPPSRARSSA